MRVRKQYYLTMRLTLLAPASLLQLLPLQLLPSMKNASIFFLVACMGVVSGCSSTPGRRLDGSQIAPAARGMVKVTENRESEVPAGYRVHLKVEHLAPAAEIENGATTYVVWLQPILGEDKTPRNVGVFRVQKNLSGEFSTVIPHRNFNLYITPESSEQVTQPSDSKVLSVALSPMLYTW